MLIYADWSNSIYLTSKLDFSQNYQNAIYSLDDRQNWKLSKQTMIKIHSSIEWMKKNWVIWKKSKNQPDNLISQSIKILLDLLVHFSGRRCWTSIAWHIVEVLDIRVQYVPNEILYPMNLVWAKSVELPNTNQRRKWDFFDWDQQYNDQEQDAIDCKWENWQNKWDQLNFLTFFNWNGIKCYVEHALRV